MMFKMNFTKHFWIVLCIVISAFIHYGCFNKMNSKETDGRIYATVNGVHLMESELQALVPEEYYDKLTSEHKKEIVEEWVNNELIYQEALKLGIDKEPEIARILKNTERDFLNAELLERVLASVKIPDEEDLNRYYEEHRDYFILHNDEYRVRFALFDNMEDARKFWREVKKGVSFSELAEKESKDLSSGSGGDLGIVSEELVEPAIWEGVVTTLRVFGLRKISDPFSVIDGFGIVIVDEVFKKGTVKSFNDAHDQVFDYYMVEKREAARKSLLVKLAAEMDVEYSF